MVCKKCGHQNTNETAFCINCGASLPTKAEKRRTSKVYIIIIEILAIIVGACISGVILSSVDSRSLLPDRYDQVDTDQHDSEESISEPIECSVTDAFFKELTGNNVKYTYHIPQVIIPGHDMSQINTEIYNNLYPNIKAAEKEIAENGFVVMVDEISYRWNQAGDILSMVIKVHTAFNTSSVYVYNLSASKGTLIEDEIVVEAMGLSMSEFYDKARMVMESEFRNSWDVEKDSFEEFYNEQLENTVADDNVKQVKPYINEKGQLCIIAEIYSMVGADSYLRDLNFADFESVPTSSDEEVGADSQAQKTLYSVWLNELQPKEHYGKIWHRYDGKLDFKTNTNANDINVPGHVEDEGKGVFDVKGNKYTYGFHVDGPERKTYYVTYYLGGKFSQFTAWCMTPRAVSETDDYDDYSKFINIYLDGKIEWTNEDAPMPLKDTAKRRWITLDLTGVQELKIEYSATKGRNDLAVLGDARLHYAPEDIVDNAGIIAAGGRHTVIRLSNGTVISSGLIGGEDQGYDGYNFDLSHWNNMKAVGAGDYYVVGLKNDGTVVHEGSSAYGMKDVIYWKNIEAIAAGDNHIVGLRSDGTLVAAGCDEDGQCNVSRLMTKAGDRKIIGIAAGIRHTVALYSDGRVYAVGDNTQGQTNVTEWENIIAVYAGATYTAGLCADGTVKMTTGEVHLTGNKVQDWKNVKHLAAADYLIVAVFEDGSIDYQGTNEGISFDFSDWSNKDIVAIGGGARHVVAVLSDGRILATGREEHGQCEVEGYRYK